MNGEFSGDRRQRDGRTGGVGDEVVGHGEGEVVDKLELSLTVVTMAGLPRRIVKVGHTSVADMHLPSTYLQCYLLCAND